MYSHALILGPTKLLTLNVVNMQDSDVQSLIEWLNLRDEFWYSLCCHGVAIIEYNHRSTNDKDSITL